MNAATPSPPLSLTRVIVSYQLAASLRIRSSYDWHQRVWECFPDRTDADRDFLTRLDDKDGEYQLLILSPVVPCRPEWCPCDAWESKVISTAYFEQDRYAFQLRANPTKKVINISKPKVIKTDGRIDRNKNSRRVALVGPDELRAWLARKAAGHGFSVEQTTMRPFGNQYFKKADAFAPHFAVDFQGVLKVTEPEKFRQVWFGRTDQRSPGRIIRGIGSAKAFGLGMLVIAPLPAR
jgi:CRISPR system Cascade subunit CasE